MGVTLAKGGNVSLSKAAPNLTQVMVGLGWDARSTTGADFDLDVATVDASGSVQHCCSRRASVSRDSWVVVAT